MGTTGFLKSSAAAAALAIFMQAAPAIAQTQTYNLDIPEQDLGSALRTFARTTRQQVTFDSSLVRGKRSTAVRGNYTARDALDQLLAGTGFRYRSGRSGLFFIEPAEYPAPTPAPDSTPSAEADMADLEIVVTASKRPESLKTIALSVQAITGANIQERSLRSVEDVARLVPSMTVVPDQGLGTNIILRGVAPSGGSQPTVVTYLDDILIPNSVDPMLYDVARVEVLKGPQGDLYGASAAGGLLRYVEERPDPSALDVTGELRGSTTEDGAGNYGAAGVANLPVGDSAAVRASAVYDKRGGFIDNFDPYTGERRKDVNDLERYTGRLAGLWMLSDTFELNASAMYNSRTSGAFNEVDRNDRLPDNKPGSLSTSRFFFPERVSDKAWVLNVTANLEIEQGTLTSATGYVDQKLSRKLDLRDIYNLDPNVVGFAYPGFDPVVNGPFVGNPNTALLAPFTRSQDFEQFTQEIRFSSDWDFPVQLLAGAFYLRGDTSTDQFLGFTAPIPEFSVGLYGGDPDTLVETGFHGEERVEEIAGFANLRMAFAEDRGELKAGVRYYDRKNPRVVVDTPGALFPNAADTEAKDHGALVSASASYKLSQQTFAFARYAEGFRPGVGRTVPGFSCIPDFIELGIDPSSIEPFTQPEKLDSYEAGIRRSGRDGRYSVSATGYVIKYQDIQQSLILPTCAASFDVNAGRATIEGLEIEARFAPMQQLSFLFNVGYSDARLDRSDPFSGGDAGEQLQYVPEWTASVQQDYRAPFFGDLDLIVRSDLSYTDKRETQFGLPGSGPDPTSTLPDYTLINAQVGIGKNGWEAVLFVDNLSDELPIYGTNQTRYFGTGGRSWMVGTPRTWGLRFRSSF